MEFAIIPIYIACKFVAYSFWCTVGARLHGHQDRLILKGIGFGIVRSLMGALFGLILILWLLNVLQVVTRDRWQLYLLVYVPVRWVEWSFMVPMLDKTGPSLKGLVIGKTPASAYWRLGGILISCLADLPLIAMSGGLPIGRFMC